jgi:hypothetical protein
MKILNAWVKKRLIICILIAIAMVMPAACAVPPVQQTGETETVSATTETYVPTTELDAIAAAEADELHELIAQYQSEGKYESVYAAASRLIELDPSDTDAYTLAVTALYAKAGADIDEINRLLALGGENAKDIGALTEWAEQHQPKFIINIPFSPDYSSADQINTEGITAGNLTNAFKQGDGWYGGLLTSQGGWAYLARMDEDLAIYKMRADGSEYQRVGDACGTCLNVVGDWLYYIGEGGKPYKMRTDGSMASKINDDNCAFLSVSGDWMYYSNFSDGGCLYKVKTDGTEPMKLTDGIVIFPCVAGGWVYYCEKKPENAGFCRVSVDGAKPQTIMAADMGNYCIEGDWIYYNSGDTIWRVHGDGSGKEVFFKNAKIITAFNIAGRILYISAGLKYEMDGYRIGTLIIAIDMESMESLQKVDFNTEPVCTGPDGWIYFMDDNEGLSWYSMDAGGNIKKIG